jgi:hypothetical protein
MSDSTQFYMDTSIKVLVFVPVQTFAGVRLLGTYDILCPAFRDE